MKRVVDRTGDATITRKDLHEELGTIVAQVGSKGKTPANTLDRVMQNLRDDGVLEFTSPGIYTWLGKPSKRCAQKRCHTSPKKVLKSVAPRLPKAQAVHRVAWRDAVLMAVQRLVARRRDTSFSRKELITEELETIIEQVGCEGATPAQTLSRVLQTLRAEGLIEFHDKGQYSYLGDE